jgi:hypothetical protein
LAAFLVGGSALGWSDSLQLKDGHHYYGKYAGGTEGVLAFQTEGSVQYFSVSDVVLLVFGESGEQAISPLGKKSPTATDPKPSNTKSKARKAKLVRASESRRAAY